MNELDIKILLAIIDSDSYISSALLSSLCNASISTIRQEIDIINTYLQNYKCHIEAKASLGYMIVIEDNEIAIKFIINFQKDARRFKYMNFSYLSSAYFIIRKLLTTSSIVTIENISDEIFKSKSTVLRILDSVKDILAKYNLQLISKRNIGLFIVGNEWDKRICLINQHKVFVHSSSEGFNDSNFKAYFLTETSYEKTLNSILSSAFRAFPFYKTAAINLPKIRNLLFLNFSRGQFTKDIEISNIKIIKQKEEFELATYIYKLLPNHFIDNNLEDNILLLTLYLVVNRSYTNISEIKNEFLEYKSLTENFIVFLASYYDIQYCFDTKFIKNFSCYLKSLNDHLLYRVPYDTEALASSIKNGIFTNDLCALFGLFYYQNKGIYLDETDLINAYSIINLAISGNTLLSDKKRILIYSRYGVDHGRNVEQRIRSRYNKYISDIETIEFSELFSMNLNDIDIIATDDSSLLNPNMYLKNIPSNLSIINFSFFRVEHDFSDINRFFLENNLSSAIQIFKKENFHKINAHTQIDVIKYIYELHKEEFANFTQFYKDIELRNHFVNPEKENGLIILAPLAFKLSHAVFDVIIPNKSFTWNQNKVSLIIFYQIGSASNENHNIIKYLTFNFMHNPKLFTLKNNNLTYDEIISEFKNIEEVKSFNPTT